MEKDYYTPTFLEKTKQTLSSAGFWQFVLIACTIVYFLDIAYLQNGMVWHIARVITFGQEFKPLIREWGLFSIMVPVTLIIAIIPMYISIKIKSTTYQVLTVILAIIPLLMYLTEFIWF